MYNPYFDPEYQPYPRSVLIGTSALFVVLPIVSVWLRFYSRSLIGAPLAIDDWITVPSAVICVGLAVNQLIATTLGGLGTHQKLVDGQLAHTHQLLVYEQTKYTFHVLGTVGLGVIKLSVLFFYRRIFAVRAFYLINNVFIGLVVAWTVAITFALAFQCYPVHTFWDKFESEYADYCVDVAALYLAVAISDMILDILIFVLPLPHIWGLKMPLRRKLAVGGVFLLGSIVVACGITRVIIFQWVIELMREDPMAWVMDTTWYSSGVLFWHITENVVGLLGCCLPTYRPLLKRYVPRLKMSTVGASSGSSSAPTGNFKYHAQAYYRKHQDDEWPVVAARGGGPGAGPGAGPGEPGGAEEHGLDVLPKNQILVRREFQTEASMV